MGGEGPKHDWAFTRTADGFQLAVGEVKSRGDARRAWVRLTEGVVTILENPSLDLANETQRSTWIEQARSRQPSVPAAAMAAWFGEILSEVSEEQADARQSLSDLVVAALQAMEGAEWLRTPLGPFFSAIVDGRRETHPIKGEGFDRFARRVARRALPGRALTESAAREVRATMCAETDDVGRDADVHVRCVTEGGSTFLDLADDEGHVVRVSAHGWEVMSSTDVPVRFYRPQGTAPLPCPIHAHDFEALFRPLVNLRSDENFRLLTAVLVAHFCGNGPQPLLQIVGPQGSAKTTLGRLSCRIYGPEEPASLRETERDLAVAALNHHRLFFDNLSELPRATQDALCRVATGGRFAKRTNYTDIEETSIPLRRGVVITCIDDVATRPDLLSRTVTVRLSRIDELSRRYEEEIETEFARNHASILGAFLHLVSHCLRALPEVRLDKKPRLADFARLGVAVERAAGWPDGSFMEAFESRQRDTYESAVSQDPVLASLERFARSRRGASWRGTASELLDAIRQSAEATWRPQLTRVTPATLGKCIARGEEALRAAGIRVDRGKVNGHRTLSLERVDGGCCPLLSLVPRETENPRNPRRLLLDGSGDGSGADGRDGRDGSLGQSCAEGATPNLAGLPPFARGGEA